jgi:hypothetical protein
MTIFNSTKPVRVFVTGALLIVAMTLTRPAAAATLQDPTNNAGQQQQQMERAKQRLQEVKDRLQLTPEQTDQIRPILMEEFQKLKAMRDKYGDGDGNGSQRPRTRMKMGRELKSIQSETDDKLRTILSKQQMEELKKIREEWREQMRERASQR